jgi:hypothetical protein
MGRLQHSLVFDESHDQYLLVDAGWDCIGRLHAVVLHVRLKKHQVWIKKDGTETGVTQALLQAGVPKEDIVLGFYRPEHRAMTEFPVA